MTGKTRECYYQAFHALVSDADGQIDPFSVVVDFEPAFFETVKLYLEESHLIGCVFHFKQALRRKMIKLRIPDDQISFAMMEGVGDLLYVLPTEEVGMKGIAFVRTLIADKFIESDMDIWDQFWTYFSK